MAGNDSLHDLLTLVARESADELRVEPGRPPVMVLRGKARVIESAVVTNDDACELLNGIVSKEQRQELDRCGEIHFTYVAQNSACFGVSAAMHGETLTFTIRNLGRR